MKQEQEQIYNEGYAAYNSGYPEEYNPYTDLNAEYWSDGWADG